MYPILAYLSLSAFAIGVVFGLFIPFDVWAWLYNDPPHDLGESWRTLELFPEDEVLEGLGTDRALDGLGGSWKVLERPARPYDWERDG